MRSFETKLPAKFFAVSASPFRIPSPSNACPPTVVSSQFQVLISPIHFSQHDIYAAENQHHVCHVAAQAHVFQDREINQTRWPHPVAIRVRQRRDRKSTRLKS